MSSVIQAELSELKRCCESVLPDAKLVTCVPSLIRVEIKKSEFKQLAVCLTFPVDYPQHNLLVELKSRTLAQKLLQGLARVTETEAAKLKGKPHALHLLRFVDKFLEENSLCCCSEEISDIKALLADSSGDKLKLMQKTSSLSLHVQQDKYFVKVKIKVPNDYPNKRIELEMSDSNFPRVFKVWFLEQAREIARRCVEPPLKPKPKDPPFQVRPSLKPSIVFLVEHVKRYPKENCLGCGKAAFPSDPKKAILDETAAAHVERVYCSHIYHHDCLILYLKTPPFEGGKKCHQCNKRIYHESWKVTPELAEARWAREQAKARELEEVVEFLADLACPIEEIS